MTCSEKRSLCSVKETEEHPPTEGGALNSKPGLGARYDPELLYVECRNCGKPLLWEPGRTTELLQAAGVELSTLDESCLIVSEGCPSCRPRERHGFTLAVVRIAGMTPEEAMHMAKPAGRA